MFVNFESFVLMVSKGRVPPTFLSLFCVLYVRILTCAICFIGPKQINHSHCKQPISPPLWTNRGTYETLSPWTVPPFVSTLLS